METRTITIPNADSYIKEVHLTELTPECIDEIATSVSSRIKAVTASTKAGVGISIEPQGKLERKSADWIYDGRSGRYRCSECLAASSRDDCGNEYLSDYCPVCGSYMKGIRGSRNGRFCK